MVRKLMALLLAALVGCPTASFAQDDPLAALRQVPAGARVRVDLKRNGSIKATLVRVTTDAILVRDVDLRSRPLVLHGVIGEAAGTYAFASSAVAGAAVIGGRRTPFAVAAGQTNPELVRYAASSFGVGAVVRVRTASGGDLRGRIASVGTDSLTLGTRRGGQTVAYAEVVRLDDGEAHPERIAAKAAAWFFGVGSIVVAIVVQNIEW